MNLKKTIKLGFAIGIFGVGITISAITIPILKENYEINKIRNDSSRIIEISEEEVWSKQS